MISFKHTFSSVLPLAFGAALLAASATAQATVAYDQNLIVNGDAESDVSAWTAFDGYSLFQSVEYGDNWVKPTQPGPDDRGAHMFTGLGAQSAGYQIIELGNLGATPVSYSLSGWLGGWLAQEDNALLYVSFLDTTGIEIGYTMIGPVMPADRGNATGLFFQHAEGLLPTGTTSLMFSLSMERLGGGDNDGYADNLRFTLSAVPEPSQMAMLLAGLGVAIASGKLRRRRQG